MAIIKRPDLSGITFRPLDPQPPHRDPDDGNLTFTPAKRDASGAVIPRTILERLRDNASAKQFAMTEATRELIAVHSGLAVNADTAQARRSHMMRAGFLARMLREYLEL